MLTNDAIRLTWVPGILQLPRRSSAGFKDWLKSGEYVVDTISSPDSIRLTVLDLPVCLKAVIIDADKICAAMLESLQSISEVEKFPRSTAWMSIKSYYAAFFAAHVISRISGSWSTFIYVDEIVRVREKARNSGIAGLVSVRSGSYRCTLIANSSEIILNPMPKLGSHESAWSVFNSFLKISRELLKDSLLASEYITKTDRILSDLILNITKNGAINGNWLSEMRNSLNYQLKFNAWYPHKSSHEVMKWRAEVWRIVGGNINSIDLKSNDEISRFLWTSFLICSIAKSTAADICARSGGEFSAFSVHTNTFCNLVA